MNQLRNGSLFTTFFRLNAKTQLKTTLANWHLVVRRSKNNISKIMLISWSYPHISYSYNIYSFLISLIHIQYPLVLESSFGITLKKIIWLLISWSFHYYLTINTWKVCSYYTILTKYESFLALMTWFPAILC